MSALELFPKTTDTLIYGTGGSMNSPGTYATQATSNEHKDQRDSARAERDSAREERDVARTERDGFQTKADGHRNDTNAQNAFVATISHDLRNPIAAIKMAVQVIRESSNEAINQKMIELIDRNADEAGQLLHQLLDAHLIRSGGKLPIHPTECSLLPTMHQCIDSLPPQQKQMVELKVRQENDIKGYWDAPALERAVKNLLSNAFKFGDPTQKIELTIWQGPDITSISVQSFGEVISLENQLKIFDPNFRVHHTDTATKIGWGLGLTLVKGIAEAHGGKVDVTSSKIEGAIFTIRIPNNNRERI